MSLGIYLKETRDERQLSLRGVERLAKERQLGAELSSGYLSMLERDEVKEPSPRILFALASIYEVDYIDLMKRAGYIPNATKVEGVTPAKVAFRGASSLDEEQRRRVQRIIDFELSDGQQTKQKRQE